MTISLADRKHRWSEALQPGAVPGHLYIVGIEGEYDGRPWPWPEHKEKRVEWGLRNYDMRMERITWLDDDAVPSLDVFTGTEVFAAAFGCEVRYPEDDMPSARPLVYDAAAADALRTPALDCAPLALLFDIADAMRARAGKDALVRLPDIQSPMDIAALIWDKTSFYQAMMEQPDAVQALAAKVADLMCAFLDEWFRRYGREFLAHYPDYYMPFGITLSNDEIGCISEQDFQTFFLPELCMLSERYGAIGIHCCASARHQWSHLRGVPGLCLINLNQPPHILREAYSFFETTCMQMHDWCGDGSPETWASQLPPQSRVVLRAAAKDRDEALRLADSLRPICRP